LTCLKRIPMNENYTIREEKIEQAGNGTGQFLNDMSDRLSDAGEEIAELTDGVEELSDEIKSLLDNLRAVHSKTPEEKKDKLESFINRLEGVSTELQNALWAMSHASADLLENDEGSNSQ
jgi:ABC-type transporter Mla subunit MlaD